MTEDEITEFIENITDAPVLLADTLAGAFIGLATEEDTPRAVYSIEKCINKLAEEMPYDEATEYFWFNVAGAQGDGFPLFISTPEDEGVY
jgi:hypothetical protein